MKKTAAIGIDIGGTSIKFGLVGPLGNLYWESQVETRSDLPQEEALNRLLKIATSAYLKADELELEIESIGIGAPGLTDTTGVIVDGAPNVQNLVGAPLSQRLAFGLNLPVIVANDAEMMAIGEQGILEETYKTLLFFTLGTGIGGAMILNGKIFSGHYGFGGELGVFPMVVKGEVKYWEDIASTEALVNAFKHHVKPGPHQLNGEYIIDQYRKGEPLAKEIVHEWAHYVGLGISGYVNVFNPQAIILGGGIVEAGEVFIHKIEETIHQYAIGKSCEGLQLKRAKLGNRAGLIGAALYSLSQTNSKVY
ncbi:ROK family protein [Marinoscillum sp. MHG1-6]|uniref:ROK family protein n=1 Tax=Marinoscillum sp. MHG1-6 TaxID=2959627 RepID=UPI0021576457|nr:ROK family protein [Marinoscillum sp. MHG1-6]